MANFWVTIDSENLLRYLGCAVRGGSGSAPGGEELGRRGLFAPAALPHDDGGRRLAGSLPVLDIKWHCLFNVLVLEIHNFKQLDGLFETN